MTPKAISRPTAFPASVPGCGSGDVGVVAGVSSSFDSSDCSGFFVGLVGLTVSCVLTCLACTGGARATTSGTVTLGRAVSAD
ncbi:MAG: hypothetical protein HQK56_16770 [Deltaproteobacteria bacterium]|nr:hypothetical protein [Deltaproteobacteria bacterium]